jgi:hypothetical protein
MSTFETNNIASSSYSIKSLFNELSETMGSECSDITNPVSTAYSAAIKAQRAKYEAKRTFLLVSKVAADVNLVALQSLKTQLSNTSLSMQIYLLVQLSAILKGILTITFAMLKLKSIKSMPRLPSLTHRFKTRLVDLT